MIIGTAGHIDHGKTTLVRALTGVDTDRLPEEQKRGISIELGYAFLPTPDGRRIGFIDVPGHERLVHTMIAGASGMDFALLLVAADDGPMPQTREHLAVLSLLGVSRGAVAVTKADRVDALRLAQVCEQARALLQNTPLAAAPVLPVSAATGRGIDALKALVFEAAATAAADADADADAGLPPCAPHAARAFRLAVDRAFTLAGTGTVATGTVHAGRVAVGDELAIVPAAGVNARAAQVRVRSLHAQNQPAQTAHERQRCALALAGVGKDDIHRGQWLCAPAAALSTQRLDARVTLWHGEQNPLRSGARVLLHAGAVQVAATVAVLDADALAPGATALVQLLAHAPVAVWHGDRLVLRDAAASRTLAGGVVLDPFAPTRYRRTPQRLAELAALAQPVPARRLRALLDVAPHGVDLARTARAWALDAAPAQAIAADDLLAGDLLAGDWALGAAHVQALRAAVRQALQAFHTQQPDELGPDAARLRRLVAPRLDAGLWHALLQRMAAAGDVVLHAAVAHLPSHAAQLSANEARIAQKTAAALAAAGFEGAWVRDLAQASGEGEVLVRATLARLARRGELHQVVKDLFYPAAAMRELAAIARRVAAQHAGDVLAAQFRDATGLGRKRAIQILEHFDRIGLTRRVGDVHRLRTDCTLFADG